MSDPAAPLLHFGGPDRPPRHLRNLLRARIDAVPVGGEIDWATYYFRDRDLAEALIAASDRGVSVNLHMEGHPRRFDVNKAVLKRLRRHGLGGGFHVHAPVMPGLAGLHPHLHSKIYAFSHPVPTVLVGSFNPSGDEPEDPGIIAEIGDQDRGHNLLAEFAEPVLYRRLVAHVRKLGHSPVRLRVAQNRPVRGEQATAYFYPRLKTGIINAEVETLGAGDRISGAISHLKKGKLVDGLIAAAGRGVSVRLVVHDTERRVPEATVTALARAGIAITRYRHPDGLPLHAKFLVIDTAEAATAWFGSFNYNPRSRWLNREILLSSTHLAIAEGLSARLAEIEREIGEFGE